MSDWQKRMESATARFLLGLPAGLLRVLAGKPVIRDDRTLDVQCQLLLKLMARRGVKLGGGDVGAARRMMHEQSGSLGPSSPAELLDVDDLPLQGASARALPARRYRPADVAGPLPAIVFFHGGGFVVGDLDSHDAVCRALAHRARAVVVAVDYRLAPEHPAPAAVQDTVAAFRDIVARAESLDIDPQRLAVAGDSAGGNLAAVVALETRGDTQAPRAQALFYPVVDFARDHPSKATFAQGFFLEKSSMDWFESHYLDADTDKKDPRISPLYADLAGAAPALVQVGGFDPLRDEGMAYARALEQAGVDTRLETEDGLIHGYLNLAGGVERADEALQRAAAYLHDRLHG